MKSEAPEPDGAEPVRRIADGAGRGCPQRHLRRCRADARADPLRRLVDRPAVDQWAEDEILSLEEARALFFPRGPLTVKSLRSAVRLGQLASASIAGRVYTTPSAVRSLLEPRLRPDARGPCASAEATDDGTTPQPEQASSALPTHGRRGRKPWLLRRSS